MLLGTKLGQDRSVWVLVLFLLLGVLLIGLAFLLTGTSRPVLGFAVLWLGAFDAFRYVAYGVSSRSFGTIRVEKI